MPASQRVKNAGVETAILLICLVATVLAGTQVSRRFGWPAPLVLLTVGVIGSFIPWIHEPTLPPELVLFGFLPPLLYAAAVQTSLIDFKNNAGAIGWLSVGLVLFTATGIGLLIWWLLPVPFAVAFAIGAVVAPPDAVAATSVGRRIGLPRRVVTVLEGESLVNDATALVSLRTAVVATTASITVGGVLFDFAKAVLIAAVIGVLIAKLAEVLFRRTDDPVVNTVLSLLAPFAAYAPAEALHASGVLAVVVAGLLIGHRSPLTQSAQARLAQRITTGTLQYLLENAVFLLVGLQARRIVLAAGEGDLSYRFIALVCGLTLVAVMLLRVVWVLATRLWLIPAHRRRGTSATLRWQESVLVSWAGMRGVVTLAAALTLPFETPLRNVLILIAMTVTVGTLLLQGLTLPVVARWLKVTGPDPREDALVEANVYQRAVRAGVEAADTVAGPDDDAALEQVRSGADKRMNAIWERLGRPSEEFEPPSDTYRRLRLEALRAERAEVLAIRDTGDVDHEIVAQVLASLDVEESMIARVGDRTRSLPPPPNSHRLGKTCDHLQNAVDHEIPSDPGCQECEADGMNPVHLRMCLTCGEVGCCDSSVGRHSDAHHQRTGHPVMRSIEPGEAWRWCYSDQLMG